MSLACPEAANSPDPGAWGARNRVELYPGKWQTWVLARATDRDKPTDLELRKMARAVFAKWFSDAPLLDVGNRSGSADLIEVGQPSTTPPTLAKTFQSVAKLPGPTPLLKGGTVLYVPVRFVWRAQSETSRPWPTLRVNWGTAGPCTVDLDWMLYSVGSDTPELKSAEPEKMQTPAEQATAALQGVSSAMTVIGVSALLFGVAYVVNALRPSR